MNISMRFKLFIVGFGGGWEGYRQDRIHVHNILGLFENRFTGETIAVISQPLDVADLDRHLREFVGVLVGLDAIELRRRHGDIRSARAHFIREVQHFILQVQQQAQSHI